MSFEPDGVYQLIVSNEAALGSILTVVGALVGGAISWGVLLEKVRRHSADINEAFKRIRNNEDEIRKLANRKCECDDQGGYNA